jgi:hypothetical protein
METEKALQNSRALATGPCLEVSSPLLRDLLAYVKMKINVISHLPLCLANIPLTFPNEIFAAYFFIF